MNQYPSNKEDNDQKVETNTLYSQIWIIRAEYYPKREKIINNSYGIPLWFKIEAINKPKQYCN